MLQRALNYHAIRELARKRLPRGLFEYIDRGSEDEHGIERNRRGWADITLHPSALVDVGVRSLETELFGQRIAMPVAVAPTALAGLVWYEGEVALARAAAAAGVPFCVATQSVTAIERIATSGAKLWFQLYLWRDRAWMRRLLVRAEAAGATALLVTVDTAMPPKREYNVLNGFGMPIVPTPRNVADVLAHPRWMVGVMMRQLIADGVPTYPHYPPEFRTRVGRLAIADAVKLDDRVCWDDVAELRRLWRGPLLIKGVMRVDDALRAVAAGLDGIVVSNHGARNLDSAPATSDVLGPIADAVGHKLTVLVDSGVRRGSDIVKALALGARGVLLGRAPLLGTAVAGEAGARHMLEIFRDELDRTMGMVGRTSVASLGRDLIAPGGAVSVTLARSEG